MAANEESKEDKYLFEDLTENRAEIQSNKYLDKCKGFLAVCVWILSQVTSTTCCQLLDGRIPDFELNLARMSSALVFFIVALICVKKYPKVQRNQIIMMCGYSIVQCLISIFLYIAVTYIPIAMVSTIGTTSLLLLGLPIFLIVNKDIITVRKIVAALLCVGGVILVIQPKIIFKQENIDNENVSSSGNATQSSSLNDDSHNSGDNIDKIIGYILALGFGVGSAIRISMVKKYQFLKENLFILGFWASLVAVTLSSIPMAIFETPVLPGNWKDSLYVILHCSTYITGLPSVIIAAYYLSGNTVNILYSTSVVFMLISQYTILSHIHPGHRNWMEVLGVVFVLIGATLGSVIELFTTKKEEN